MPVDLRISRHDHHNLEVKTHFAVSSGVLGQVDLFLFLPKSFLAAQVRKEKLMLDFRSRSRLSVRLPAGIAALALRDELAALLDRIEKEGSEDLARRFAANAAEILRVLGRKHRDHAKELAAEELEAELRNTGEWRETLREEMGRKLAATSRPLFRLLDEYLSYLFAQYLADLKEAVGRDSSRLSEKARGMISTFEAAEKQYWAEKGYGYSGKPRDFGEEAHVLRLSHLKKFFQAKMHVHVEKGATLEKLAEPFAAAGAGCAALWMAFFQGSLSPRAAEFGLGGSAVLTTGVFAYIMKDRIKEWGRKYFMKKASGYFPDVRQKLFVERKEIGATREWLRVSGRSGIADDVRKLRQHCSMSDLEHEIPEDVIHYRVERELKAVDLAGVGQDWAFQDVLRINLNRYLRGLDDPYKEIAAFDHEGQLTRNKCHRAYPLTMIVVSRECPTVSPVGPSLRHLVFRVWLDKTGIDRVERLPTPASAFSC